MAWLTDKIRIVLVRPTDSRNIGSVARAMHTTGFQQLVLVEPEDYDPPLAARVAGGSSEILTGAIIAGSVIEAVAHCDYVVGATRRQRETRPGVELTPRMLAEELGGRASIRQGAILFGPERAGLTNTDLETCHRLLTILVARPELSLNLAQAVMVVCYELYGQLGEAGLPHTAGEPGTGERSGTGTGTETEFAADATELHQMYLHLAQAVEALQFPRERRGRWESRVRGMLQRARLRREEIHLVRALAHQIILRCGDNNKRDRI